ncbi:hypothetical protein [Inquilinus sp.]|jgi:hypothetical protein|uniref:hypothetical protein n=1 Tax=Inquilinus sp. TaxID=1932117 RepID=UPI0037852C83
MDEFKDEVIDLDSLHFEVTIIGPGPDSYWVLIHVSPEGRGFMILDNDIGRRIICTGNDHYGEKKMRVEGVIKKVRNFYERCEVFVEIPSAER